jgi:cytoskeletal protein CcmA (bactofilin family)
MAQIIKHRRGSIDSVVATSAKKGELIMATGSIGNMNGPWIFIGHTDGVNGGYNSVSKIYQGTAAPSITVGSYGSTIDGTPFYATGNKTLYVLNKDGNSAIDLTGNIEGNTISGVTINNITGSRASFNTFVSASALNVSGDTQMGGTLFVDGDTSINADLYVTGNTYQTGSIYLTGDVKLSGSISIGDMTTDTVNFIGEVSSSIVPDVHNAFDLGSPTQNWRNLHVSGTAYVDTLEANNVNFGDLGILNDLTVSGSTFLGNGGDITVISGSVYNDQLTNNRVVIVGTQGLLEDDANFTFDGTELNVGVGNFTVQQSSGNIDTAGTLNVGGATTLESSLDVTGSAQFKDTINVDGEATLASATVEDLTQDRIVTVGAGGSLIDSSGFTYNGTVFKIGNGQFEVDTNDGDVRTSGSLTVEGGQTVNGDVTVNGVLTVTGNTQLQSNLYISGNLEVLGSSTNVTIQSQTVEIDDNIIRMNAYSPFLRYAGFEVMDSGSSGVSASMLWDSQNDYWMFVSSSGASSKFVGTTAGAYGSEVSLTDTYFPIATGTNTIGDSLLRYSGTTLSFNTNKFTIDS